MFGAGISLIVEKQETETAREAILSSPTYWSVGLAAATLCATLLLQRQLERSRRLKVGSLLYVSALHSRDGDIQRVEQLLAQHRESTGRVPFDSFLSIHCSIPRSDPDGHARTLNQLAFDVGYALRTDSITTPTNVLPNLAWPYAVATGIKMSQNRGLFEEGLTIWYLADQNYISEVQKHASLGGLATDAIRFKTDGPDVGVTLATPDDAAVTVAISTDDRGDPRSIYLCSSTAVLKRATEAGHRVVFVDSESENLAVGDYAWIVREVASALIEAMGEGATRVELYCQLPTPITFGLGVQLGLCHEGNELLQRLTFREFNQADSSDGKAVFDEVRFD